MYSTIHTLITRVTVATCKLLIWITQWCAPLGFDSHHPLQLRLHMPRMPCAYHSRHCGPPPMKGTGPARPKRDIQFRFDRYPLLQRAGLVYRTWVIVPRRITVESRDTKDW